MERRIGRLISILYRKSQIYLGQALKQYDVSSAEYPILIALKNKDGVTQEELSTHLHMDKSAVTRIIQTLVSKGFVLKNKDENDQRCNRVYLAQKGCEAQSQIDKALMSWNAILMMNMKEEKQDEIYALLMQMVDNVTQEFLDEKWTE